MDELPLTFTNVRGQLPHCFQVFAFFTPKLFKHKYDKNMDKQKGKSMRVSKREKSRSSGTSTIKAFRNITQAESLKSILRLDALTDVLQISEKMN